MVMMERFEGYTSSVDCKGDDGEMSLTFGTQSAYDYAVQTWSRVNRNENDMFILIANHDGCGPDHERQPYYITNVNPDPRTLTTFLTARPADWQKVAVTYDITFGQRLPLARPDIRRRGFFGDIWDGIKDVAGDVVDAVGDAAEAVVDAAGQVIGAGVDVVEDFFEEGAEFAGDVVEAVGDAIQGNARLSRAMDFPFNVRNENERSNIYSGANGRLNLDCINCFIAGNFRVTGRVAVESFKIVEFSVAASPQNVRAALVFEASANTLTTDRIDETKELFSAPIPGIGIAIPGIFKLGGVLSYEVGFSASITGQAVVDFGLKAFIPDESLAKVDLGSRGTSQATGFKPTVEPVFEVKTLQASLAISAYSQPRLFFGVEIISAAKADVALTFRLPELETRFTPKYDPRGACVQNEGESQTGIDIEANLRLSLNAEAEAGILGRGADWRKELLSYAWSIYDGCIPFGLNIPSIGTGESAPQALSFAPLPSQEEAPFRFPRLPPAGWKRVDLEKQGTIPVGFPVRKGGNGLVVPPKIIQQIQEIKRRGNDTAISYPSGGVLWPTGGGGGGGKSPTGTAILPTTSAKTTGKPDKPSPSTTKTKSSSIGTTKTSKGTESPSPTAAPEEPEINYGA